MSKVKRYFSAGSQLEAGQIQQSRSTTNPIEVTANKSVLPPPESFSTPANNTMIEGDRSTNRILSSFFQEKGDRPLTQIEYEGVMSLLEKSKASITLPLPESPKKPANTEDDTTVDIRKNQTFAPYSQKVLRNTSMYDANSTTLATPDYKPVYHTFTDTSVGNVSVKRVYQFSGLPSPYRTRIKAPNLSARKAKRLSSTSAANRTVAEVETQDSGIKKPLSNTANSLLSILEGGQPEQASNLTSTSNSKPLHNPFARNKRRTPISLEPLDKRAAILGANDITKTVLHSKVEELDDKKATDTKDEPTRLFNFGESKTKEEAEEPKELLFGNSKEIATEKSLSSEKKSGANGEAAKPLFFDTTLPKNRFGFGEKKIDASDVPSTSTFNFGPKPASGSPAVAGFGNGTNETFPFGAKDRLGSENSKTAGSANKFGFGAKNDTDTLAKHSLPTFDKKASEEKYTQPKPLLFKFGASSKPNASTQPAKAAPEFKFDSKTDAPKPAFSFGAIKPKEKSEAPKPAFSFSYSKSEDKPAFSFGDFKSDDKPAFSFGNSKPEDKPAFIFGKSKPDDKHSFSFGNSKSEDKPAEPKAPLFSFGKLEAKFTFGKPAILDVKSEKSNTETEIEDEISESKQPPSSNGATFSNGNGAHSEVTGGQFEFPPVKVENVELDRKNVEEYKSLFQF